MTEHTQRKYNGPYSTTDIIIKYTNGEKTGIVLIERKNPPYGKALPGGFAEVGLTLEQNACKEAREETNLEVILENPGTPLVYSDPKRDPRGHMISHTYYARGEGILRAGDDASGAELYTIEEVKEMFGKKILVFDHETILKDYLRTRGHL